MHKKLKGFTLLEVMVVLAIIGVLAGLVLFGVAAAQRNTRDTERKAALTDINAGAADLYTVTGRPVSGIVLTAGSGEAWVYYSTGGAPAACNYANNCVVVPLDGAANPATQTATDATEYYFHKQSDGFTLGACLENQQVFDNSTSGTSAVAANFASYTGGCN